MWSSEVFLGWKLPQESFYTYRVCLISELYHIVWCCSSMNQKPYTVCLFDANHLHIIKILLFCILFHLSELFFFLSILFGTKLCGQIIFSIVCKKIFSFFVQQNNIVFFFFISKLDFKFKKKMGKISHKMKWSTFFCYFDFVNIISIDWIVTSYELKLFI